MQASQRARRAHKARSHEYSVPTLCPAMDVHPSSYYDWLNEPLSKRGKQDQQLVVHIKQYWLESGGHAGYRNFHLDLIDADISCGRDRVLRLMRSNRQRAVRGYRRPGGYYGGSVHEAAPNLLNRQSELSAPNQGWVSDITCIHTQEGFLFLAVVMDLFARNIIGWSMSIRMKDELMLDALTHCQRQPTSAVMLHCDQGSQYKSRTRKKLLETLDITPSMRRRGNCHDNAVAESFFTNLKKEKIRRL